MSEQLFPDAVAIDPVTLRTPRQKRGFGVAAFVLGLLAVIGDVVVGILVIAAFSSIADKNDSAIGFAFVVLLASIAAFWGGILFAVLSIVFGIISLVRKQARVLAITGILFGLVTLVINVTVGVLLVFNFDQFSSITNQLS